MRLLVGLLFCVALIFQARGQSPQGINYQGVARDSEGKPLVLQDISVRISILKGASTGDTEFAETHSVKTNSFGLFMLVIGHGKATTGSFEFVSWAIGNKWLQIELDPAGGNSFQLLGSQQLMSVPYAFYATYSGNGLTAGQGIKIQNNQVINTGDADNNPLNETITDFSFGTNKRLKITEAGVTKEIDLSPLVGAAQNLSEVLGKGNDAGALKITNMAAPVSASDAATKQYVDSHTDGDSDAVNEIQDLTKTGNTLSLTGDATTVDLSSYLDNTDNQELSLTGNMLGLTNSTTISLATYLDNTDNQSLSTSASGTTRTIAISGGNNISFDVADNDNNATNELQDLSRTGNTLSLTGSAASVDLTPYLDNTDNQTLSTQSVDANTRSIAITGGNTLNVDVRDADASVTNEIQDLSLSGSILMLSSDASTVNLASFLDNTDNQNLTLSGNTLSLTNDATTVDLSGYMDNTDNQNLSTTSAGTNRGINISGGTGITIDVADNDNSSTNEIQNLGNTVSGTLRTLTISGGTGTTIDVADNDNDASNELQNLNQVLTRGKDAGGLQIQNLGAPAIGTDASTKGYVDNTIAAAIATNYAFKATYSFINTGGIFSDSPIALSEDFDDFNVVATMKFTAPVAGVYSFTVSGSSLLGGIPLKLKITSGSVTLYDIKRQTGYPLVTTINYLDSNIYNLNPGDTVELVVTSALVGERVEGVLFGSKL